MEQKRDSGLYGVRKDAGAEPGSSRSSPKSSGAAQKSFATQVPSISLPKGGGAIRGMGEKFGVNSVTGTGSLSVPIATSPGRSGFGPSLSLSYDSGSGNGPFGFGWSLALPSITRKTDKGLPRYFDAQESDVFLLSGAEDLVPVYRQDADGSWVASHAGYQRDPDGFWVRDASDWLVIHEDELDGYRIRRYRPRIEGLFARIERWTKLLTGEIHWRSISRDNITTWYGKTANSRIADPADPARIFSWLICESYDDKGNAVLYQYKPENSDGVDLSLAHERNRTRSANRYLKRIKYTNKTPRQTNEDLSLRTDWLFEVVFDYGEHYTEDASGQPSTVFVDDTHRTWPARQDSFSTYRSGFEVRTCRRCQRVLMFHHFPDEPEVGAGCLVRSTDFTYSSEKNPADARNPIYSFLLSVTQSGYKRQLADGYLKKSFPPVEFTYSEATIQKEVFEVDAASFENLPSGLDGGAYQWVDLDGEGLSGILSEQTGGWFYKRNLSPINLVGQNGSTRVEACFAPVELVATRPASGLAGGRAQFMDLAGDGQPDLVTFRGSTPGFYERTADAGSWEPFTPFTSLPVLDWDDPNLKFVDLTGDGHADLLITEDEVFRWHPSLAEEGFGPQEIACQSRDEETGPHLVFADGTQSIYLADLSGDGLSDLVRIRNGEVCYWPNLGYGRFGAKITMDNSPWFDFPDQFDQKRIRLADIDGSGTTDILYLHGDGVRIYFNQSGNSWSQPPTVPAFPPVDSHTSVTVVDLLGNGTACLVWSSSLPDDARHPMRYIDLMGGQKPHLLIRTVNNLGAETAVSYAPSTRFYLADQRAGRPWITKLPFPVHVVEKMTVTDKWRHTKFSTTYSYHHGYFDGIEREFRGFGRVEQVDTEDYGTFAAGNTGSPYITDDQTLYQPPVKTITWFHTGAAIDRERILTQFQDEYFPNSLAALPGDISIDHVFNEKPPPEPDLQSLNLAAEEWREALRACKGLTLRQEVYEIDVDALQPGGEKPPRQIPVRLFSAATHNCGIRCLQPRGDDQHAVFLVTESEALSYHYELDLRPPAPPAGSATVPPLQPDPRVAHTLNLSFDEYGNIQQSVAVGYPRCRTFDDSSLAAHADLIREVQSEWHVAYNETHYTNDVIGPADVHPPAPIEYYRLRLPCEVQTYELTGFAPAQRFYFDLAELRRYHLSDTLPNQGSQPVARKLYHEFPQNTSATMRMVEHARTLFFKDDLSGPLGLATLGKLGLTYEQYKLALTEELLGAVFTAAQLDLNVPAGGSVRDTLNRWKTSGYLSGSDATEKFGPGAAGQYWMRSGIAGFAPDAALHFYLPEKYTDAFDNPTTLEYDGTYDLFMQSSSDALGNTTRVAKFDYRVLAPAELEDMNGNHTEAYFDVLGRVIAVAVKGKGTEADNLTGYDDALANPELSEVLRRFDVPALPADGVRDLFSPMLGNATTRFLYHFGENIESGKTVWGDRPAGACSIVRELHVADVAALRLTDTTTQSSLQIAFECSDGMGTVLMKRSQAEPETDGGSLRWIVSGKTVLNNKGKPVKQYEPYFTSRTSCSAEGDVHEEVGVTPLMYYDAPGRLVRTEMPDGTFSRVEFSPWHVKAFDANDTVLESRWYQDRAPDSATSEPSDPEKRAAWLAAKHADTPSLTIFDSLGRDVISIAHNRYTDSGGTLRDEKYLTFTRLDAEGKPLWIHDARGNLVMQYLWPAKPDRDDPRVSRDFSSTGNPNNDVGTRVPAYDIAGNLLFQHSMDAGNRWMLNDAAGKPMFAWDFNERQTGAVPINEDRLYFTSYDQIHRPTAQWLTINGGSAQMAERFEYRDTQDNDPSARQNNLQGQPIRHYDPSGLTETIRRDFKGNVEEVRRTLNNQPEMSLIDWQGDKPGAQLDNETFIQITEHDALNRMTHLYNWHQGIGSRVAVYERSYNQRGALVSEKLTVRGSKTATGFDSGPDTHATMAIQQIRYNAKSQREYLALGNGTLTQYDYDPQTFRLRQIQTTRPADATGFPGRRSNLADAHIVQQLLYTYDPVGNITEVEDQAYKPVFFDNGIAEPQGLYQYDALYRLVSASGRESAQGGDAARQGDDPAVGNGFPVTDQTLRRYCQTYEYDQVGNFVTMKHTVPADSASGWTRHYRCFADSNRLHYTWTGSDRVATQIEHHYDTHGNMLNLLNVSADQFLRWDHRDMIASINLEGGGSAYYQYDSCKQRTRKRVSHSIVEERIYLGGHELYRKSKGCAVVEKIESHHLFQGEQRVLLVDDVISTDNPTLPVGPLFRYQYSNHLGSACLELEDQAEIISYEEYHPYGTSAYRAAKRSIEASPKRYRYAGMERDKESGLSYHGARYHAVWVGRWTGCDPLGKVDGLNLYAYTKCSPMVLTDPHGTTGEIPFQIVGFRVGGHPGSRIPTIPVGSRPPAKVLGFQSGGHPATRIPSAPSGVQLPAEVVGFQSHGHPGVRLPSAPGVLRRPAQVIGFAPEGHPGVRVRALPAKLPQPLGFKTGTPSGTSDVSPPQPLSESSITPLETPVQTITEMPAPIPRSTPLRAVSSASRKVPLPTTVPAEGIIGVVKGIAEATMPAMLLLQATQNTPEVRISTSSGAAANYDSDLIEWKLGLRDKKPASVAFREAQDAAKAAESKVADDAEAAKRKQIEKWGLGGASFSE